MKRTGNIRRTRPNRRYYDRRQVIDERRRINNGSLVIDKVLVTGDRRWSDITTIVGTLKQFSPGTTIVHGACQGVDNTCAAVAEALGFKVIAYPADWNAHGRGAGPIRNQLMIDTEHTSDEPIHICIAFHNDIIKSKGTKDCIKRALKAGIEVLLVRSPSCVSSQQASSGTTRTQRSSS